MHKVFISYHHQNDQQYKDELIQIGSSLDGVFINKSVADGEIEDSLDDESIRRKVRDEYLKDSTVTILLAGKETIYRKHIDWEIYSSMYDGKKNKKSGIFVINLPTSGSSYIYPDLYHWQKITDRSEYVKRYPNMPDRIIDNLITLKAKISIVPWERISVSLLKYLIDDAYSTRSDCQYDLKKKMMKSNFLHEC